MEEVIYFYDEIMFFLLLIIGVVLWVILKSLVNVYFNKYLFEGVIFELI